MSSLLRDLHDQRGCLADLQAAFAGWQHLAGIEPALVVEQVLESRNQIRACHLRKDRTSVPLSPFRRRARP